MTWISVKAQLPELDAGNESEHVLIVEEDGYMAVSYLHYYPISGYRKEETYIWREQTTGCGCCSRDLYPTHWMPLPSLPEENL